MKEHTLDSVFPLILSLLASLIPFLPNRSAIGAEIFISRPAELSEAVKTVRPGDAIRLAPGEYADAQVELTRSGNAREPLVLEAVEPGQAVFTGCSSIKISGDYWVLKGLVLRGESEKKPKHAIQIKGSHCILNRCAVISYSAENPTERSFWVSLYGSRNTVEDCAFSGHRGSGVTLCVWLEGDGPGHVIKHNRFCDRPKGHGNGFETIRIGDSKTSRLTGAVLVESNLFENCDGEIEIVSNRSCGNTYRSNTFMGCAGCLTLRHGDACTVEGNWFLGECKKGTGGVRVIGRGHRVFNNYFEGLDTRGGGVVTLEGGMEDPKPEEYEPVSGACVVFNTFVDCGAPTLFNGAGFGEEGRTVAPSDCFFAYNIVSSGEGPVCDGLRDGVLFVGNLSSTKKLGFADPEGFAFTGFEMVKASDSLYRPAFKVVPPGIIEDVFPFVTHDMDGQPRKAKRVPGCDELSDDPPCRRLWSPSDEIRWNVVQRRSGLDRNLEEKELIRDQFMGIYEEYMQGNTTIGQLAETLKETEERLSRFPQSLWDDEFDTMPMGLNCARVEVAAEYELPAAMSKAFADLEGAAESIATLKDFRKRLEKIPGEKLHKTAMIDLQVKQAQTLADIDRTIKEIEDLAPLVKRATPAGKTDLLALDKNFWSADPGMKWTLVRGSLVLEGKDGQQTITALHCYLKDFKARIVFKIDEGGVDLHCRSLTRIGSSLNISLDRERFPESSAIMIIVKGREIRFEDAEGNLLDLIISERAPKGGGISFSLRKGAKVTITELVVERLK